MRNIIIAIVTIITISSMQGQTLDDIIRYSFTNPSGSARYLGAGGSMGALGADYGAISFNPAGLASYWTSEFVLTPSIISTAGSTDFNNSTISSNQSPKLKTDNFGLIINRKPRRGILKSFNAVIGMNRIADFNESIYFKGNSKGSITERFNERANGKSTEALDFFEAGPAYETGAIYSPDENNNYITDFIPDDIVLKSQNVNQSGGINEFVFGFGGNISNRFMVGATIGVPYLNYIADKTYAENDEDDQIPGFNALRYREYLNTSGLGFNFKAGIIAKLSKSLSVGGAIHSPTTYSLTDNYNTQLTYGFTDNGKSQEITKDSPDGRFRYKLQTPWRANASIAFKKKIGSAAGFLNGDVEWVDYRNGQINLGAFNGNASDVILGEDINKKVDNQLKSAVNLKVGGELALKKFRFRLGYNMIGSPYAKDNGVFFPAYSFGLGWRENNYYFDFGWRNQTINKGYIPYQVIDDDRLQLVQTKTTNNKIAFTIGFQF